MELLLPSRGARRLGACFALCLTACFDNGTPAPEPTAVGLAREYSGLWVPESAEVLRFDDSFYNSEQGRLYIQGLLDLEMQLSPSEYQVLEVEAKKRGYAHLESRRVMPADSIGYGDAYPLPPETPGLYLTTRGQGANHITVVLRSDTQTFALSMVQVRNSFFHESDTAKIIRRYECENGTCSADHTVKSLNQPTPNAETDG